MTVSKERPSPLASCCARTLPTWVAHLLPTFSFNSIPLRALFLTPCGALYVLRFTPKLIGALEFLDHVRVLACAVARLGRSVKGPVIDLIHDGPIGAVKAATVYGDLHPLPHLGVLLAHLHVAPWEHLIEFLLPVLTSAVFYYGVDQLIYPRCFGELRDLVAQSLGFVF